MFVQFDGIQIFGRLLPLTTCFTCRVVTKSEMVRWLYMYDAKTRLRVKNNTFQYTQIWTSFQKMSGFLLIIYDQGSDGGAPGLQFLPDNFRQSAELTSRH